MQCYSTWQCMIITGITGHEEKKRNYRSAYWSLYVSVQVNLATADIFISFPFSLFSFYTFPPFLFKITMDHDWLIPLTCLRILDYSSMPTFVYPLSFYLYFLYFSPFIFFFSYKQLDSLLFITRINILITLLSSNMIAIIFSKVIQDIIMGNPISCLCSMQQ